MNRTLTLMCVCFCAGLLGGLLQRNRFLAFRCWGIPDLIGVRLAPTFTKSWLYPHLVWGGLWGLVYFISVGARSSRRHWTRKALWVSLLPSAFHLFVVSPYWTGQGLLCMNLGDFAALFIVLYNFVWGPATGIFSRLFWGRS